MKKSHQRTGSANDPHLIAVRGRLATRSEPHACTDSHHTWQTPFSDALREQQVLLLHSVHSFLLIVLKMSILFSIFFVLFLTNFLRASARPNFPPAHPKLIKFQFCLGNTMNWVSCTESVVLFIYCVLCLHLQDKSGVGTCTWGRGLFFYSFALQVWLYPLSLSRGRQTADTMTAARRIMHFCHLAIHSSSHTHTSLGPLSREKRARRVCQVKESLDFEKNWLTRHFEIWSWMQHEKVYFNNFICSPRFF